MRDSASLGDPARRGADVRQPRPGSRGDQSPQRHDAERVDEHRNDLLGPCGRIEDGSPALPQPQHPRHPVPRNGRLQPRHRRRRADRKIDEQDRQKAPDQPPDRKRRSLRRSDGRSCIIEGRSGSGSPELPPDARDGTERLGSHRIGRGGRRASGRRSLHGSIGLINGNQSTQGPSGPLVALL